MDMNKADANVKMGGHALLKNIKWTTMRKTGFDIKATAGVLTTLQ